MDNTTKRPDRRVLKTKRAIRNALAKLLTVKNMEDITVKDIADTADINRKTFYNYYNGVYQVVEEIENELTRTFEEALRTADFRRDLQEPHRIFDKLTEIFNSDKEFYGSLLGINANTSVATKIGRVLKDKVRDTLASQFAMDPMQLDVLVEYSVTGMLSVFQNWYNSERRMTTAEISDFVGKLTFFGLKGILEGI